MTYDWNLLFWALGLLLLTALLGILLVRKRYQTHPWFTALIAQYECQSLVLWLVHGHGAPRTYFLCCWIGEIITTAVGVGLIYEAARATSAHVPLQKMRRTGQTTITLFVTLVLLAFFLRTPGQYSTLMGFARRCSLACSLLTVMLAGQLVLSTFLYGMRARLHSQAIVYGTVLLYSGKIVNDLNLLSGDVASWSMLQQGIKPVYLLCLLFWCFVFWFEEPKRVVFSQIEAFLRLGGDMPKLDAHRARTADTRLFSVSRKPSSRPHQPPPAALQRIRLLRFDRPFKPLAVGTRSCPRAQEYR